MATQKKIIGKLPVFRGGYNKDVVYYKHNIVTYLGSSFISTKDENMSAPCTVGDKEFILSSGWEFFSDSSEAYFMDERFDEMAEVTVTTDDDDEVNDVEPDVVNEAIRKTPQTISKAEQAQARANIGAASLEENEAFKTEVEEQVVSIDAKVSDIGSEVKSFSFFELVQLKNISFSNILTRKGYFLSSGRFEFSEDYRCTPVPLKVKSNTTINVDKACYVVVFDNNSEFVERVQITINSPYIATSDCMIHLYTKTEYVEQGNFMAYDVKEDLSKTKTAVVDLENNVGTIKKNISDINGGETSLEVQYTEGGYIDTATGEVLAADNWKYSDFIDISTRKDNALYLMTDENKSVYNVLCDKNKNIIRALNDDKGWLSEEYIPKEAHYVRLSCRISAQQELKINVAPKFLTKEDITPIRVATYNVGDWYNGSTKYIPDDEVIGRGHIFRRLAQKYDLTLLCMNETQEQLDRSGNITDALKYLFEFKYPYRYRHYRHQFGFVSKVPYDSIKGYNFNNDSSRGFLTFDIQLKGKTIKIFIAHCDTGTDFEVKRREQFVQLIAELKTAPYFMCFGDFNCFTTSEFELFANEGFNLANHGFWGDYDTWTNFGKESETWPNKAIDNIITSPNISIEQVVVDETDISDHRMLVSEIKIL